MTDFFFLKSKKLLRFFLYSDEGYIFITDNNNEMKHKKGKLLYFM